MRIWIGTVAALAACGSPARTTTTTATTGETSGEAAPPPADAAPPEPPAATPCPEGNALARAARKAWGKGKGTATADCVALRVDGGTLWLIDGTFEPDPIDDEGVGMWTALVTPAGEVRHREGDDGFSWGMVERSSADGWRAVDLDGDGDDEVVWVTSYDHGGHLQEVLSVARVDRGALALVGDPLPLSEDNSAAGYPEDETRVCDARWELAARRIAITYGRGCERTGTVVYAFDGEKLREVR